MPIDNGSGFSASSVNTAAMVSVIPYSCLGLHPNQSEIVSYWSAARFWANQHWRSLKSSTGLPLARIILMGAANRLAVVASWRAAWPRNPLAVKDDIRATLAPAKIEAANE